MAALVPIMALVACFVLVRDKPQTVRLSNGTELTFLAITHGPSNVYQPGGAWQRFVNRFAPAQGIGLGPIKLRPVPPMQGDLFSDSRFTNRAVVWIAHREATKAPSLPASSPGKPELFRAAIADESGYEWVNVGPVMHHRTTLRGWSSISSWPLVSFPRRGETLRFRIYRQNPRNEWEALADFTIPNPTPGPYPAWKASDLPISRGDGDLEVALVGLESGTKSDPWLPGERPFARASFEVRQRGQSTESWVPDRMEAMDATGNEPWLSIMGWGVTNGLVYHEAGRTSLGPGEVWKLQMRFANDGDLPAGQTWTSPDLAVEDGELLPMKLTTNWQSGQINLECRHRGRRNTILLELNPPPKDARLRHPPEAIDDQGRSVEIASGGSDDSAFLIQWKIPPGTRFIKVTIALAETRAFEFLARPAGE